MIQEDLRMKIEREKPVICVVGLGYVGLPLATQFSKHFRVIGFDINTDRIKQLNSSLSNQNLMITDDPQQMRQADFILIAVPTPVTESKEPDLSYVTSAARTISKHMKAGCVVILESTVYPGVTEEVVKPILEESGLHCGKDFKIACSPERINPGDEEHGIDKVVKVVSGMDDETSGLVAQLYRKICPEVFQTKNIKTAEASKLVENVQRDLNIALVNEFRLIFERMGLSTKDVLDAAATKWNFQRYYPGLVGGHCIPVDPYYLIKKAEELNYHPQLILAGRAMNDYMTKYVAHLCIEGLDYVGKTLNSSRVLIMGLAYKENIADTRESPAKEIIKELRKYRIKLYGYDPLLNNVEQEFGVEAVSKPGECTGIDCLVITVNHDVFRQIILSDLKAIMSRDPVLIDIRGLFDGREAKQMGFYYKSLQ
jgi:UDP-N-acetyl-D-galactosamine dehydrogenase